MDRKGYSKLQAQARRDSSEMLRRFKEQNPEKYAELLNKAKYEVEHNTEPERHVTRYTLPTRTLTIEELEERIYIPEERHFLIQAKDKWEGKHLFFESFIPNKMTNDDILQTLTEKHPRYSIATLMNIEPCQCPACIRRYGAS